MNPNPKVTIITVAYNAEEFIEPTIKSIINQSYHPLEYIIIDGASKDGTVDIIKKYEDKISNWVSEPDKSLHDAMNKGIQKSTGDYVLFMNAGDRIKEATSLEKMMDGHQQADLIYSKAAFVDEQNNTRPWHKETPQPADLSSKSFMNGMVICHQCMLAKKAIVPFYKLEPWKIASDIDWSMTLMKQVKTKHFYDDIFCLFLEGGLSDARRMKAVKERFRISWQHFGLIPTLVQHLKIAIQVIKRGSVS